MKRINFYDQSISLLWEQVLEMGSLVEKLLKEALISLKNKDTSKMLYINQLEEKIDNLNDQIEVQALELISLQQPLTKDLRKLAAFMRITKDLERVGDLGLNLGEAVIKLEGMGNYFKPLIDISKMAEMVIEMIGKALRAYKNQDVTLAKDICEMDNIINQMYLELQEELVSYMKKDSSNIEQACQFLLIATDLERIGDHAENIAEMINYMVTGKWTLCD